MIILSCMHLLYFIGISGLHVKSSAPALYPPEIQNHNKLALIQLNKPNQNQIFLISTETILLADVMIKERDDLSRKYVWIHHQKPAI